MLDVGERRSLTSATADSTPDHGTPRFLLTQLRRHDCSHELPRVADDCGMSDEVVVGI